MVTVMSGKGGVGKTSLAASLAIAIARHKRRVLLVDADLSLASLDLLMGVMPRHTLADVLAERCPLEEAMVESYAGVRILPASRGDADLADLDDFRRDRLFRSLARVDSEVDLIVFDAGSGVGRNVTSLARLSGENLVVTTPEPPAISAAFALLKVLDRAGLSQAPGIVVNQASGSLEAQETWNRILKTCKQFLEITPEWLGWVPLDPSVRKAVMAREPFVLTDPTCGAARSIQKLAQRLLRNDPVRDPEGAGRPSGVRERLVG